MKYCECGCGEKIKTKDSRGREKRYVLGHQNKRKEPKDFQEILKEKNKNAPYCKCSCGNKVLLSLSDIKCRRYKFRGYLPGHNNRKVNPNIKLPEYQEQVILGTLLGDGCLSYPHSRSKYPRLRYTHGYGQKDYVYEKARILSSLNLKVREVENKGCGEMSVTLTTSCIKYFKDIYELLYTNGKKVSLDYLNKINEVGLAFWWADDGNYRNNLGRLHTEGFTKAENYLIAKWFKDKWDIEVEVSLDKRKNLYYLRFRKEPLDKFITLIKPHIPKTMKYKVGE